MLDRRKFIKNSVVLSGLTLMPFSANFAQQKMSPQTKPIPNILPNRLKRGDLIGLVTPGGNISKEELHQTVKVLEGLGFMTYYEDSVLATDGYFAGTDQERADELMHMFSNTEVDAILCVRGGYGAIRILELLDYELIQQNPKIFIGYSDITALLISIYERTGLITFHGPVGVSTFNEFTVKSFEKVLINPKNRYKYPYKRESESEDNPENDIYTINDGITEGKLIGGNLSVIVSMIGSAYEPNFEDKIVYIEEIGEKVYRVDKMLFHLLYATNLKKAAGIVLGIFSECGADRKGLGFTLQQAIGNVLKPIDIPVSYGLSFGHVNNKITIPNGITAKFNATKNSLKLLGRAVK